MLIAAPPSGEGHIPFSLAMSLRTKPGAKGRVPGRRPPSQTVDTALKSYPRTEPLAALHTLQKLLSSLPSRVGGCAYKLTHDEHKLSLHLLAIVEPFVALGCGARPALSTQPAEVLDLIASHIHSKRDLLTLGLTCARLRDVVFPRHFEYRVVRCKVSAVRVWNHLCVNRALARNVRTLEVLDERAGGAGRELIPRGIRTCDTDLESTDDELKGVHKKHGRFLLNALAQMTGVQTVVWACGHSPISMQEVWPLLLKCPDLQQVTICDNLVFGDLDEDKGGNEKDQLVLPGLRTAAFKATGNTYGASKNPALTQIHSMLNRCPRLESLEVAYARPKGAGFTSPLADNLLTCGRWSRLQSLTLGGIRCSSAHGFAAASAFLAAHACLEILHIDITFEGNGKPQLALAPNSLPRLREVRACKELVSSVLVCPCDTPRPLETIKGVKLGGGATPGDREFLGSLKRYGASVRRLELAGWNDLEEVKRLAECVPGLTWLDIGKKINPPSAGRANRLAAPANANAAEWAVTLASLTELTTFHGARFFFEVSNGDYDRNDSQAALCVSDRSRVRENDRSASVLTGKCPKLRRVDHWDENAGKVILLSRDGDKIRWEARRIKG